MPTVVVDLEKVDREIESLTQQIETIQSKIERLQVGRQFALEFGQDESLADTDEPESEQLAAGSNLSLADHAEKILSEKSRPMGTGEIANLIELRGHGRDLSDLRNSLYMALRRGSDEMFYRPDGKKWALTAWRDRRGGRPPVTWQGRDESKETPRTDDARPLSGVS